MDDIQKCVYQLVEHPPYSPDLAPSDCYLFLKIKKGLGGHDFARDDDVMNAVDNFRKGQNGTFYTEGIHLIQDYWSKCVNVGGDYVDFLKLTPSTLGHRHINHPS